MRLIVLLVFIILLTSCATRTARTNNGMGHPYIATEVSFLNFQGYNYTAGAYYTPLALIVTVPLTILDIGLSIIVDTVALPLDILITPNNIYRNPRAYITKDPPTHPYYTSDRKQHHKLTYKYKNPNTPLLFQAIEMNNNKKFDELIKKEIDLNESNHLGITMIVQSIKSKNSFALDKLIAEGANTCLTYKSTTYATPFQEFSKDPIVTAIEKHNNYALDRIFSDCFDINKTADYFHRVINAGNMYALKKLLQYPNVDINIKDSLGYTPMMWTITGNKPLMLELLLKNHADMYQVENQEKYIPFTLAAQYGRQKMLSLFIEYNIDVNFQYKKSTTALSYTAYKCNNITTFKLLMQAGANPNIIDKNNQSIMSLLEKTCKKGLAYNYKDFYKFKEILNKYD